MFTKRYNEIVEKKRSLLCVGLDPAYEGSRKEKVIPARNTPSEDILDFCLDMVQKTGRYASAYKPNLHYILPLSLDDMRELTDAVHAQGALCILDEKLSDIGSTNMSSCFWASEAGFDAITASPFPGVTESLWNQCNSLGLGCFLLCLMSNPEAPTYMKAKIGDMPAYESIASDVERLGITGTVIGATVPEEDRRILAEVLTSSLVLVPGIGAQAGSLDILDDFGKRCIVNVSRAILFAEDPSEKAKEYCELIRKKCFAHGL